MPIDEAQLNDMAYSLSRTGWISHPSLLDPRTVELIRTELERSYNICREIQLKNGVQKNTDGTLHHLVGISNAYIDILEFPQVLELINIYFEGPAILNSFGGVRNTKQAEMYVSRIHRDVRFYSQHMRLMCNILIMADNFTAENGATHVLEGSHNIRQKPTDEHFKQHSRQLLGAAGTVVLFDSNLWHAAGINHTEEPRRALTLTFTPPFMKQQCDYPRMLGYDQSHNYTPRIRQLLGYNARIPTSLDEWYQPASSRLYQPDQG